MNKIIDWILENKLLSIFLVAIVFYVISFKETWHYIDAFVTVGTLFMVWFNYNENKKKEIEENQLINFFFKVDGKIENEARFSIVRKNVTRAEIAGFLSFIQDDSTGRYNIPYMMKQQFFDDIYSVQKTKKDSLIIEMDLEQCKKFKKIENDLHKTNN